MKPEQEQELIEQYYRQAIAWASSDEEELAVETFSRALRNAGLSFVGDPMGAPQIPNWNRVSSALPEFLQDLREAVEARRPFAVTQNEVLSAQVFVEAAHLSALDGGRSRRVLHSDDPIEYRRLCVDSGLLD